MRKLFCLAAVLAFSVVSSTVSGQVIRRLRGRVTSERGTPIAGAQVRAEALFGYAAGTFAGQRTFATTTNAKGDWNILGFQAGIWLFDVSAPGYMPETIALPIQILATETTAMSGVAYPWQLVLKARSAPPEYAQTFADAVVAARSGDKERVRLTFSKVPETADSDYLAGAGRVCLMARDPDLARTLFTKALELDPQSYRAALGIASLFLMQRDFDSASRAFDAARNRTADKDEQKWLTVALSDLAQIKVR